MENELPQVPQDVLDAIETLPDDVQEEINTKVLIFCALEAIKNPAAYETKEKFRELVIKNGKEHMRLIREAVLKKNRRAYRQRVTL
jgi:hypothetical protein